MNLDNFVVDDVSLLVSCPTHLTLKSLKQALAKKGFVASLPAGENQTLKQAIKNLEVVAVAVKTNEGIYKTKAAPRSATGPDFKKILPSIGVPTETTLRIHPKPAAKTKLNLSLQDPLPFLIDLRASGVVPSQLTTEARQNKTLLRITLEGSTELVEAQRNTVLHLARDHGGLRRA